MPFFNRDAANAIPQSLLLKLFFSIMVSILLENNQFTSVTVQAFCADYRIRGIRDLAVLIVFFQ